MEILKFYQLYAKASKCILGSQEEEYLGYIISKIGAKADPQKKAAIQGWPIPTNLKVLRGFLGLTRYYCKFVQGYGMSAAPLTTLLEKNSFVWTKKALQAFNLLKQAMSNPPIPWV